MHSHIHTHKFILSLSLVAAPVLFATGCDKEMPVPQDLAQKSEALPVEGNTQMGKTFAIGDFRVTEVKRGGKGTASVSAGSVASASASKQKFGFQVAEGSASLRVDCVIEEKESKVAFTGGNASTSLDCTMGDWALKLAGATGTLSRGEMAMQVSTYTASAISLRPDGYYLETGGTDVAALSKSQVLVRTGVEADTRSAIGAASAALLIFSGIPG